MSVSLKRRDFLKGPGLSGSGASVMPPRVPSSTTNRYYTPGRAGPAVRGQAGADHARHPHVLRDRPRRRAPAAHTVTGAAPRRTRDQRGRTTGVQPGWPPSVPTQRASSSCSGTSTAPTAYAKPVKKGGEEASSGMPPAASWSPTPSRPRRAAGKKVAWLGPYRSAVPSPNLLDDVTRPGNRTHWEPLGYERRRRRRREALRSSACVPAYDLSTRPSTCCQLRRRSSSRAGRAAELEPTSYATRASDPNEGHFASRASSWWPPTGTRRASTPMTGTAAAPQAPRQVRRAARSPSSCGRRERGYDRPAIRALIAATATWPPRPRRIGLEGRQLNAIAEQIFLADDSVVLPGGAAGSTTAATELSPWRPCSSMSPSGMAAQERFGLDKAYEGVVSHLPATSRS